MSEEDLCGNRMKIYVSWLRKAIEADIKGEDFHKLLPYYWHRDLSLEEFAEKLLGFLSIQAGWYPQECVKGVVIMDAYGVVEWSGGVLRHETLMRLQREMFLLVFVSEILNEGLKERIIEEMHARNIYPYRIIQKNPIFLQDLRKELSKVQAFYYVGNSIKDSIVASFAHFYYMDARAFEERFGKKEGEGESSLNNQTDSAAEKTTDAF